MAVGIFLQLRGTIPCLLHLNISVLSHFLVGKMGFLLGAIELLVPTPQPESIIVTCFGHRVVLYENSELSLLFCV